MEKQLFEWDGWDQQDTMAFTFYKVKLIVDIGPFPAGSEFESADLDYGNGTLQLRNDKCFYDFKMNLRVAEMIGGGPNVPPIQDDLVMCDK